MVYLRGMLDLPDLPETYVSAYGTLLLFLVAGLVFVTMGLLVSRLLRTQNPNPEKLASYECGEEAIGPAWVPLNARFYVVALVFVVFDVELVYLFPTATVYAHPALQRATHGAWGWFALNELALFVGVLALGLAYAWRHGHLDWIRPRPAPPTVPRPLPTQAYTRFQQQKIQQSETRI